MLLSIARTMVVAGAIGCLVGVVSGALQGHANAYAEQGLLHARAALWWACVGGGAWLGGVAGIAGGCAWTALRATSARGRMAGAAGAAVGGVLLWTAYDAVMLGPAFHASPVWREVWAWLGIGVFAALVTAWRGSRLGVGQVAALLLAIAGPLAYARVELGRTMPSSADTVRRPNVIFVVLDALRADHVGAYGYRRDTTPFIDRLARDGVRFERAFAPASMTRMSVPSYLASVYPAAHGIIKRSQPAHERLLMLAEVLRNAGYATAAWMPNPSLEQVYRFYYGFDAYYDGDRLLPFVEDDDIPEHQRWETASTIQHSALGWLGAQAADTPVFMYLHYRDIHAPYVPPPPYDTMYRPEGPPRPFPKNIFQWHNYSYLRHPAHQDDVNFYLAQYDGDIRYTNDQVERFFGELRRRGVLDDALVIVTADHGEAFMEHWALDHGRTLFDEVVHVPLILQVPGGGGAGRVVPALVELVDVAPTVLDYVGLPAPAVFAGRSLRPLIDGTGEAKDAVYLEGPDAMAVRTERWKLIVDRETRAETLYDLAADPGEQQPLKPAERPGEAAALSARLSQHLDGASLARTEAAPAALSATQRRKLEALGYLE